MSMVRFIPLLALVMAGVAMAQNPQPRPGTTRPAKPVPPSSEDVLLARFNVAPTTQGVRDFLAAAADLRVDEERVQRLIDQLGSESYREREDAYEALRSMPRIPVAQLTAATQSQDPEIAMRARQVLAMAGKEPHTQAVLAALRLVARQSIKGLAVEVHDVMKVAPDTACRSAARLALVATALPQDAPLLRKLREDADAEMRAAALTALHQVLADQAREDMAAALKDPSEHSRLIAAQALAEQADRRCLPVLAELLLSEDQATAGQAEMLVVALTGKQFGQPATRPAEREKWAAALRAWIDGEGRTAKLQHPLKMDVLVTGLTLVCLPRENAVVEVNASGLELWRAAVPQPWACQVLPNGNRLVGSFSTREVMEFDRAGRKVWSLPNLPSGPMSVQRLANGDTLVACADASRVIQYKADGSAAWQVVAAGRPADARRLDNGHTLIALHQAGQVIEVDAAGRQVWQLGDLADPQSAQRLANGNTLVAHATAGFVAEYNRQGQKIWSAEGLKTPLDVQRLPNGNTLVAEQEAGVREYDSAGRAVWEFKTPSAHASRARRF